MLVMLVVPALIGAGCGPDAPRDNPYDVPQTGVYGTTYRRNGGTLGGVSISASPANITASSDGQGNYNLELTPGSRQALEFFKQGFRIRNDTVDVPERGRTQRNVILYGQITVDTATVRTVAQRLWNGSLDYHIEPCLVVSHPDGRSYLDSFNYLCRIDTAAWTMVETGSRGENTRLYGRDIDTIPGVAGFSGYVVGRLMQFLVSSSDYSQLINRTVPGFLAAPDYLAPSGGAAFTPPGTLSWINGQPDVDITVEVWRGTSLVWTRDTTNISDIFLPVALPTGNYVWKVIARDINGNRALAEAIFTCP